MSVEHSQLINDDKKQMEAYQKSFMVDGQALMVEATSVQARIVAVESALQQLNTSCYAQQLEIASLAVAVQNGMMGPSGGGGGVERSKSGKRKILESILLNDIGNLASDRTKYHTWARDIKVA